MSRAAPGLAPRRWWPLLAGVAAVRLAHAALAPAYPDELYHWVLSGHPAPAYLDHPALTHWLARLGTDLFGHHLLALRLPTVLLSLAWLALLPPLVRRLRPGDRERSPAAGDAAPTRPGEDRPRDDSAALREALLLTACAPAVLAASVMAVPYAPLLLGWTACLLCVLIAETGALAERVDSAPRTAPDRATSPRTRLLAWCGAGAGAALATWSQASAPLLLVVVGLWMLLARRRSLTGPAPWLGLVVWALLCAPLFAWSVAHDGAPWLFQVAERHAVAWHPEHLHELLLLQLLLVGPLVGLWMLPQLRRRWRLARGVAGRDRDVSRLVLLSWAVVVLPFVVQAVTSERWLLHWTLPAYALLLPDATAALADAARRWRWAARGSALLLAVGIVVVHVASGSTAAADTLGDPFRTAQHDALAAAVAREWAALPEPRELLTTHYQVGSLLQWAAAGDGPLATAHLPPAAEWARHAASGPDYARLFPVPDERRGWNALVVAHRRSRGTSATRLAALQAAFERVSEVAQVPDSYALLRCEGFRGR